MKRWRMSTWLLLAALVGLLAVSFVVGSVSGPADQERFAGADSVVTSMIEEMGVTPWFEPVFEPGSGEIESGLFALQAALGGAVFGYCVAVLRERSRARRGKAPGGGAAASSGLGPERS